MNARPNPYVGPRPFESNERLPARECEVEDLRMTLLAARIVLLHSPSGAGKTSLLEAKNGLRADMQSRQFIVHPTIRVNKPLPDGVPATANRYEMSALVSLTWHEAVEPARLVELGLQGYLDGKRTFISAGTEESPGEDATRGGSSLRARELLIFDQFEEILTTDRSDDRGRGEFLDRLARVLEDPYRWAVFAIREDYLGALEPWARRLPTNLASRFRIDLLGVEEACEAIRVPAGEAGVNYDEDALEYLLQELRQITVQTLEGGAEKRAGQWIEPVQLQVVCHRLWSFLESDDTNVELSEAREYGNVDKALAGFYSQLVGEISQRFKIPERRLREWVSTKLISPQGIRQQVLASAPEGDGLVAGVLEAMQDGHFLRGEDRRGAKWYELAHDRLVAPVNEDNARWRRENIRQLTLDAEAWAATKDSRRLYQSRGLLLDARAELNGSPELFTKLEEEFVRQAEEKEATRRRARRNWLMLLGSCALILLGATLWAVLERQRAVRAQHRAVLEEIRAKDALVIAEQNRKDAILSKLSAEAASRREVVLRQSLDHKVQILKLFADYKPEVKRQCVLLSNRVAQLPKELRESYNQSICIQVRTRTLPNGDLEHTEVPSWTNVKKADVLSVSYRFVPMNPNSPSRYYIQGTKPDRPDQDFMVIRTSDKWCVCHGLALIEYKDLTRKPDLVLFNECEPNPCLQ